MKRLRFPVVSIGNLSTGGAGKNPVDHGAGRNSYQARLAGGCALQGLRTPDPDPRPRGPGRNRGGVWRRTAAHRARGGRPGLRGRQRYDAGLLAEGDATAVAVLGQKPRALVHLLDDGFQHRHSIAMWTFCCSTGRTGATGCCLRENLREPLTALRRATLIAIPAEDSELEDELKAWGWEGPVWRLRRKMEIPAVDGPVLPFCGIARPRQFFDGLERVG